MLGERVFVEPRDHILFNGIWERFNSIYTEIQLRKIEKDIDALQSYINVWNKKLNTLEEERRKCVKWRLTH